MVTIPFCIFSALLLFLSYKSLRGGIDYLNFFKSELAKPKSDFTPFATIIAPCKGLDDDLEKNLSALFRQDYPGYEVIFVVNDKADEALTVIKEVSRKAGKNTKIVVAGNATDSSQKAENLREAILHVSDKSEVFVFVDSDVRPSKDWLRDLVAPLQNTNIGVATGYRWFISEKPDFASEMRSVWNASIASALGKNVKSNFCWGGSMAIRRDIFEKLDIREKWRGVLSDDFAVTRAMREANLPIVFVPQALTASVENCSFRELLEFTTRQMKITRVYAPHLWVMSFFGSFVFNLVLVWGILIFIFAAVNEFSFWAALLHCFSYQFSASAKAG